MLCNTLFLLGSVAATASGYSLPTAAYTVDTAAYKSSDIIQQDFVIVGGGAAGTYAAIALKDAKKTFVVVEKSGRLGGHARTYLDPKTGKGVDFGVQVYLNSSVVRDFFTRLNTPYAAASPMQFGSPYIYADFAAKKLLPNYSAGSVGQDYLDDLAKYSPGVEDFTYLKTPIDPNLTLKWPDFVAKTGLSNASALAGFNRPAVPGNLRDDLALYVFNDLNSVMLREQQQYGAIVNANRDNSQLFRNAQIELGSSVLYNSTVIAGVRSAGKISLVVTTPTGLKLIIAKEIIIAMPQTLDNMKPFGLDTNETKMISQISGGQYYGGVVNNTGLIQTAAYPNRGIDTPWNAANVPSVVTILPSAVDGFHYYWYTSYTATSRATIEAAVLDAISTLQTLTNITKTTPNFVDYQDFSPLQLTVPAQSINNGFYQDFNAMQGYRSTWYIGAFFVVGASQVYNNTMNMLPKIIAAAAKS